MKYAICNELFEGWDFDRICGRVAELGYEGLEVAPFTVAGQPPAQLRASAQAAGIEIIGLHWLLARTEGYHLTSADPTIRRRTGDYLCALARSAAEMGGSILVLGSPAQRSIPPGLGAAAANYHAAHTIDFCLKTLSETGVTLCLEPLGPAETSFLNTAAEAIALIERVNHPNVQLHLDVKAMATESAPAADVVRASAAHLRHFHANDPNRRGPGFGDTDFKPIFTSLREIGYGGWVSVEVFDYSPDPETIARESIRYMRECESFSNRPISGRPRTLS